MSFSGKISKRKNRGAVLLGTFMVPAAFSVASQSVFAAKSDLAKAMQETLNNPGFFRKYGVFKIVFGVILVGLAFGSLCFFYKNFTKNGNEIKNNENNNDEGKVNDKNEEVFSPLENVFYSNGVLDKNKGKEFCDKLKCSSGGAFKVKGKEIINIVERNVYLKNRMKEGKEMDKDFTIRVTGVYSEGYLKFDLYDAEGKEKWEECVFTKYVTNDMEKVDDLVKYLKDKDVSVKVLGYFGSVFCSETALDEKNRAKFLERLSQFKSSYFKVKGKEIINVVDSVNNALKEEIKEKNKMNDDFTIRITSVYENGTLGLDLYDAEGKEKWKECVFTNYATNDMNKVEKLVKYLNSKPKKIV